MPMTVCCRNHGQFVLNISWNPESYSETATDSRKIVDAITYPGITDALSTRCLTNQQIVCYTSEYYAWDPFVDLDKFINYSQYYWLPAAQILLMFLVEEFHSQTIL
jgi:hypothetical protein